MLCPSRRSVKSFLPALALAFGLAAVAAPLTGCAVPQTPAADALKVGGSASVSGGPETALQTRDAHTSRAVAYDVDRAPGMRDREMTAHDALRTMPDHQVREARECWKCSR